MNMASNVRSSLNGRSGRVAAKSMFSSGPFLDVCSANGCCSSFPYWLGTVAGLLKWDGGTIKLRTLGSCHSLSIATKEFEW